MELPGKGVSLFLAEIGEPRNNDLRLVLIEALPGQLAPSMMGPVHPIAPTPESRVYEVVWYHYVAYSVRNESYVTGDGTTSDRLSQRSVSAFLDYVAATTFASDDFPGPGKLSHWSLYTEFHCVDVVGVEEPEIKVLSASQAAPYIAAFD